MFFKVRYNESVEKNKLEIDKIQVLISDVQLKEEQINSVRDICKTLIKEIENFINSIANTPKSFDKKFCKIKKNLSDISEINNIEEYEQNAENWLKLSNGLMVFGAGMAAVTKYSENHEKNNDNSSKNVGTIVGITIFVGGVCIRPIIRYINYNKIYKCTKNIKIYYNSLRKYEEELLKLFDETKATYDVLKKLYETLCFLNGADYLSIAEEKKIKLCELVDYTITLSALLHKEAEVV